MNGIATVAGLEFRVRLRTGKWRIVLGIWVLLLLGITALLQASITDTNQFGDDGEEYGAVLFGVLALVVLGLALLITPAFSAQSVNGDRERGVLAPLQITGLTSWEITLGKLVAGWGTGLVFLLLTVPFALYCLALGGLSAVRTIGIYLLLALLIGAICALSLALSALLARTTSSGVLAYLLVLFLTGGTALVFALLSEVLGDDVRYDDVGGSDYTYTQARPDKVWWLIAANPFVVLADAAPATPTETIVVDGQVIEVRQSADALGELRAAVREFRLSPEEAEERREQDSPEDGPAVWPTGLTILLVLAGGSLIVTERRLRTPAGRLPTGQRVA